MTARARGRSRQSEGDRSCYGDLCPPHVGRRSAGRGGHGGLIDHLGRTSPVAAQAPQASHEREEAQNYDDEQHPRHVVEPDVGRGDRAARIHSHVHTDRWPHHRQVLPRWQGERGVGTRHERVEPHRCQARDGPAEGVGRRDVHDAGENRVAGVGECHLHARPARSCQERQGGHRLRHAHSGDRHARAERARHSHEDPNTDAGADEQTGAAPLHDGALFVEGDDPSHVVPR